MNILKKKENRVPLWQWEGRSSESEERASRHPFVLVSNRTSRSIEKILRKKMLKIGYEW